jgi:ABC-type multidrug transport system fused ATPase/permease subunit
MLICLGFLGVTFQVGAVSLIVMYANKLAKGGEVSVASFHFAPRESLLLLIIASIGFLCASVISSWMIYWSNRWIFDLALGYEKRCIKRVFRAVSVCQGVIPTPMIEHESPEQSMMKLVGGDAKVITRVIRIILSAVVPLITMCFAVVTIFITNFSLSLIIAFLVLLSTVFYFKVSLESLRDSKTMEATNQPANKKKRALMKSLSGSSFREEQDLDSMIDPLLADDLIKDNMVSFRGRLMAGDKAKVVSDHLTAVSVTVIVVALGYQNFSSSVANWEGVIIYLIALRYCMANFQKVAAAVTAVNRFFNTIQRGYDYLHKITLSERPVKNIDVIKARCIDKMVEGSADEMEFLPGQKVGVFSPTTLTKVGLKDLYASMFDGDDAEILGLVNDTWIITNDFDLPSIPLESYVDVPKEKSCEFMKGLLKETGLEEFEADLDLLCEEMNEERVQETPDELKSFIALVAAYKSKRKIVVFESKILKLLPRTAVESCLSMFSDRVVIIYNNKIKGSKLFATDKVLVQHDCKNVGIGDMAWLHKNKDKIDSLLPEIKMRGRGADGSDLDDDLLDMM